MMKGFITLHHLEDNMKRWKPDLVKFKERHTFLSEELNKVKNSNDWIGLNKSVEDCSSFNQSILESRLMIEFFKLFVTINFKKAKSSGGEESSIEYLTVWMEVSTKVAEII